MSCSMSCNTLPSAVCFCQATVDYINNAAGHSCVLTQETRKKIITVIQFYINCATDHYVTSEHYTEKLIKNNLVTVYFFQNLAIYFLCSN